MIESRVNLLGLTHHELEGFCSSVGQKSYRAGQIFHWLYGKSVSSFDGMTDLGKDLRQQLSEGATLEGISPVTSRISDVDGTVKYLFSLCDGLLIESVLITPKGRRRDKATQEEDPKRLTLCVSTQAGCPLDCKFCATATMGFQRNLTTAEIIDQVLQVQRLSGKSVTNIVFMGMGEPMMNYDNLMKAIEIITTGMGIAPKRVTVSTAGWADRIRQMGEEQRIVKLALSLHSAVEETRAALMPITKKFGIEALRSALEFYYSKTKRFVMYEQVFFEGLNDTDREVRALIKFARAIPCKINVIPFHPIGFTHPSGIAATLRPSSRMEEIVEKLRGQKLTVMVRGSSGEDIAAACGQLAVRNDLARPRPIARSIAVAAGL